LLRALMQSAKIREVMADLVAGRQSYQGLRRRLLGTLQVGFLIEMLNAAASDEVYVELSTPTKAGIIKPSENDENEDLLILVMPLMLNN